MKKKNLYSFPEVSLRLSIVNPVNNQAVPDDIVKIKIRIDVDKKTSQSNIDFLPLIAKLTKIKVDGEVRLISNWAQRTKNIFETKVDLKDTLEGVHILQAVISDDNIHSKYNVALNSDPIDFIIDRTSPIIHSVFPANSVMVDKDAFSKIIVSASDARSGLDLEKSLVKIDGRKITSPLKPRKKGFSVLLTAKLSKGPHDIACVVVDKAGNKAAYKSEFNIIGSKEQKEYKERYIKQCVDTFDKRIADDKLYHKKLLVDPGAALSEVGLPYTGVMELYKPPILPEEHADYVVNNCLDREAFKKKMKPILVKVAAAARGDGEKLMKKRFTLGEGVDDDNTITPQTQEFMSSLFQDPHGALEKMGVALTGQEKKDLFPAFPKEVADAYADWISKMHAKDFNVDDDVKKQRREALKSASRAMQNDKQALVNFLVDPVKTYKQICPEASPAQIASLPQPISPQEAQKLLAPVTYETLMNVRADGHNSTDVVVGVSLHALNVAFDFYFNSILPGVFPVTADGTVSFPVLPAPYDKLHYKVNIPQPGNLQVVNIDKKLMSVTITGSASITFDNGVGLGYRLDITPLYSLAPDDKFIYLVYNHVEINIIDLNTATPVLTEVTKKIQEFLDGLVKKIYPKGKIPVLEQSKLEIAPQCADTRVRFDSIHVVDDQDPAGSGELYFELGMNNAKYLFGQFDANDNDTISLGKEYLLRQENNPLIISVRGKDVDMGGWPDPDDYLGDAMFLHQPIIYGSYALTARITRQQPHWVWKVVYVVAYTVCVVLGFIIAIINLFRKKKNKIKWSCTKTLKEEYGWIWENEDKAITTYVLNYSVSPVPPVNLSASLKEFFVTHDTLYLGFDYSAPGVESSLAKTDNHAFNVGDGLGIAISENMFDKIIKTTWKYFPVAMSFTTNFNDLSKYSNIHLGIPSCDFLGAQHLWFGGRSMRVSLNIDGQAGKNWAGFHFYIDMPSMARMDVVPEIYENKLILNIDNVWLSWEHVDNIETFIVELLMKIVNIWDFFMPRGLDILTAKERVLLNTVMNFRIWGYEFKIGPVGKPQINNSEVVMTFSLDEKTPPVFTGSSAFGNLDVLLIGDSASGHKELHRVDCSRVKFIKARNTLLISGEPREIFDLYARKILPEKIIDAFAEQGYDGCYYCLREKNWK